MNIRRYEEAASILPARLRRLALALPDGQKAIGEEFRLRALRPFMLLTAEGEVEFEAIVTAEDLEMLCDLATEFSRYAAAETLRQGFVSVRGGFRLGLCGTAVMKGGENTNLRQLSSAAIRIAGEHKGAGETVAKQLLREGGFCNTLIYSAPGGGKTTLLRDLVRIFSDGRLVPPHRIALLDERGEVAVMHRGEPQMDIGERTDVLDACPKTVGIPMVLRAMNPQIIAVDEITAPEDIRAMTYAAGCGVGLLATVHGASREELMGKPLYRELMETAVFQKGICISRHGGHRQYRVEDLA